MNILPKKKWHVRTKENIERVRRDEAQAAEEERERERKSKLAEQEARTSLLRSKARERLGDHSGTKELEGDKSDESKEKNKSDSGFDGGGAIASLTGPTGHVNFFQNLEDGEKLSKGNEENAAEKKREQDEYEKKIGYSVALGQDTEELTGEKVWWRKVPERGLNKNEYTYETPEPVTPAVNTDVGAKLKNFLDPMNDVKKYLKCETETLTLKKYVKKEIVKKEIVKEEVKSIKRKRSPSTDDDHSSSKKKRKKEKSKKEKKSKHKKEKKSKKKKRKHSSSDSSDSSSDDELKRRKKKLNLERLRKQRLEREKKERKRAHKVMYGDDEQDKEEEAKQKASGPSLKQTYSSQFNPNLAKQNKLDANTKYWLN